MALGLGGVPQPLSAVSVMSVNGNVIGIICGLEATLRKVGFTFDFRDPIRAATALARGADCSLVFGVPFPFSMHVEFPHVWCEATSLAQAGLEIQTDIYRDQMLLTGVDLPGASEKLEGAIREETPVAS